jgi:hypothetical protein
MFNLPKTFFTRNSRMSGRNKIKLENNTNDLPVEKKNRFQILHIFVCSDRVECMFWEGNKVCFTREQNNSGQCGRWLLELMR